MPTRRVDDDLAKWPDIRDEFHTDDVGLLLGNGSSQAVWHGFSYRSLYEIATDPSRDFALAAPQQAIFTEMQTTNYENVLWSFATARMVCRHLQKDCEDIESHYQRIRTSLIHAVRDNHVPYPSVTDDVKRRLRGTFSLFDYVYTTNYDLLLYWAAMSGEADFKDFLWYDMYNPADAHVWGDVTKLLFLHGALHLSHDVAGKTVKKKHQDDLNDILAQFYSDPELIPLFVSEGDSADKMRSIRRNDYLSFAYWKLAFHRGPMVVFGNSLSKQFDQHIIDAMSNWKRYDQGRFQGQVPRRKVAVSIYRGMNSSEIVAEKNCLLAALPHCDLCFFDSATHALGDINLKVGVP